jgi:hypothetical protein
MEGGLIKREKNKKISSVPIIPWLPKAVHFELSWTTEAGKTKKPLIVINGKIPIPEYSKLDGNNLIHRLGALPPGLPGKHDPGANRNVLSFCRPRIIQCKPNRSVGDRADSSVPMQAKPVCRGQS